MKPLITLCLLLCSVCINAHTLGAYEVNVVSAKQTPFSFKKHRFLVIEKNGKKVASQRLYGDPAGRLPLTVFKKSTGYTFVDCNGDWYSLSKTSGKLSKHKWVWERPLPAGYIGTFRLRKGDKKETLHKEDISPLNVYLFENP